MSNIERRRSSNDFLDSVLLTIQNISDIGYIKEEYLDILCNSEKKIEFSIPFKLDNGIIKTFKAFFVQHSTILGPSIGSIEILRNASIEDCEAFAMLMSLQTSALGIPLGGSKGIIVANIEDLNKDETERLYRKFIDNVYDCIDKERNIIKLFENSNEYSLYPIIDEVEKKLGNAKYSVNRPEEYFGTGLISKSQNYSIAQCVKKVLTNYSEKDIKDINLGITMSENLDVDLLTELNNLGLKILGFAADEDKNIKLYREKVWDIIYNNDWDMNPRILVKRIKPYPESTEESILTSNVDILILQHPELRIETDVAEKIKAKYIIEAGENLISDEAETILEDNGIIVIPDFISLGGVLVNSYIEWTYGSSSSILGKDNWKNNISNLLDKSLDNIFSLKEENSISTREAAVLYAIKRLVDIREKKSF